MTRTAAGLLLATACAALTPIDTHADEPAALFVAMDATHARYHSRETLAGGELFNREDGALQGGTLAVGAPAFGARWQLQATRLAGTVAYEGRTQFGFPRGTATRLQLERLGLRVTPQVRLPLGPGSLGWQAGLGAQRIDRAIQASLLSLPATEVLHSRVLDLGLDWRQDLGHAWQWQAGLATHWPLWQRLRVNTFGEFDPFSLRPGQRGWTSAELALQWAWTPAVALVAGLRAEGLRFGPAAAAAITRGGQPAGVSSYPGSTQRLLATQLGLRVTLP